jgi:hypothetical protein
VLARLAGLKRQDRAGCEALRARLKQAGVRVTARLRKMFRAENTVDYYDREKT